MVNNIINTKALVDGDSYVVWYDICVGDECGIFILHMEGDRKLLKFVKYLKSFNVPIFFCEGVKGIWKNHRIPVGSFDNGNTIYKFIWGDKCKI